MESTDRLEQAIEGALGPEGAVTAPPGFASRVEARLFYATLLQRHRRQRIAAVRLAGVSIGLFVVLASLFVQAVDVPAWIVENVPGVLGRLDGVRVSLTRSPELVLAAVAGVLLTACGILTAALRPRLAGGGRADRR